MEELNYLTMKTTLAIGLFFSCALAGAQDEELPEKVVQSFREKYPASRQEGWWLENNLFHIDFSSNGHYYTALFDGAGEWKETAQIISEMDLPQSLKNYIRANFPSGTISYCEEMESNDLKKFLRVNLFNQGNVLLIICSDRDGKNITLQKPEPTVEL